MFDGVDMFVMFSFGVATGLIAPHMRKDTAHVAFGVWTVLLLIDVFYLCIKHLT